MRVTVGTSEHLSTSGTRGTTKGWGDDTRGRRTKSAGGVGTKGERDPSEGGTGKDIPGGGNWTCKDPGAGKGLGCSKEKQQRARESKGIGRGEQGSVHTGLHWILGGSTTKQSGGEAHDQFTFRRTFSEPSV